MNFLQFKQILALIYALKINFYLLLMDFLTFWTRRQLQESAGVLAQKILRHRLAREGLRVESRFPRGLFSEMAIAKGY
jgi:hypothetical protein